MSFFPQLIVIRKNSYFKRTFTFFSIFLFFRNILYHLSSSRSFIYFILFYLLLPLHSTQKTRINFYYLIVYIYKKELSHCVFTTWIMDPLKLYIPLRSKWFGQPMWCNPSHSDDYLFFFKQSILNMEGRWEVPKINC